MGLITAGESARQVACLLQSRAPAVSCHWPPNTRPDLIGPAPATSAREAPPWLSAPLSDVLVRRQSVREFSEDPVPVQQVCTVISEAYVAENQTWPPQVHGAASLTVLLVAVRVAGVSPSIYAVTPATQQFSALTDARPLKHLCREYVDAPALLLICGDPHQGVRQGDQLTYASMLVRAGSLGYAAWLSAIATDLAGSVFGRTCNLATVAAQQLDVRLRHLFTVAVGTPALLPLAEQSK